MPEVLQFTNDATSAANANDEPDLSIFENKSGLADDLKFLASMPELCDVTFLVGETREPVCAVKVIFCFLCLSIAGIFHVRFYFSIGYIGSTVTCIPENAVLNTESSNPAQQEERCTVTWKQIASVFEKIIRTFVKFTECCPTGRYRNLMIHKKCVWKEDTLKVTSLPLKQQKYFRVNGIFWTLTSS